MGNIVLEARHLKKDYKNKLVVDDVSFEIYEGQILGFLGPNGCGKSTIMKMLTGLVKPTAGQMYICSYNVKRNFEKALSNVGAIIENPKFFENLTAFTNLKFLAKLNNKNISNKKLYEIIETVGLSKYMNQKVSTYSLGMKQRLGIAQALLSSPKLLILDEPTNGLDVNGINDLKILLKNLSTNNKVSILISSHDIEVLQSLCHYIAVMSNGHINNIREIEQNTENLLNKKYKIEVNYPNFAGKLVLDYFNTDTFVIGKSIIVYSDSNTIIEILQKLKENKLTIFSIDIIKEPIENVINEILNKQN